MVLGVNSNGANSRADLARRVASIAITSISSGILQMCIPAMAVGCLPRGHTKANLSFPLSGSMNLPETYPRNKKHRAALRGRRNYA